MCWDSLIHLVSFLNSSAEIGCPWIPPVVSSNRIHLDGFPSDAPMSYANSMTFQGFPFVTGIPKLGWPRTQSGQDGRSAAYDCGHAPQQDKLGYSGRLLPAC